MKSCMTTEWANSRRIARVFKNGNRHHQRFTVLPLSLTSKGDKKVHSREGIEWLISHHATCQKRYHLLSYWLTMKFVADNTSAENRAKKHPDLRNPKLQAYFRNNMFTPGVTDQFIGVANHRSRSKARAPLEVDLICRDDGGDNRRPLTLKTPWPSSTGLIQTRDFTGWLDTSITPRYEILDFLWISRMLKESYNSCSNSIIYIWS